MAARNSDDLTPPDTSRPATLAQSMRRELAQSVSDRLQTDPKTTRTRSDSRIDIVPAASHMSDEDVRRTFCSVEKELERLRTAHVTYRKSVKFDPQLSRTSRVPLPISDNSRSPSPVLHSSPSSVMKRARDSGQFSPADLRVFQSAFDALKHTGITLLLICLYIIYAGINLVNKLYREQTMVAMVTIVLL